MADLGRDPAGSGSRASTEPVPVSAASGFDPSRIRRLLICGGRDFTETNRACAYLDRLLARHPIETVINGGARGADSIASYWARSRGLESITFKADWKKHGKGAGPIRNQQMLEEGKPDAVLAFPGGRGTQDMVQRARATGTVLIHAIAMEARQGQDREAGLGAKHDSAGPQDIAQP